MAHSFLGSLCFLRGADKSVEERLDVLTSTPRSYSISHHCRSQKNMIQSTAVEEPHHFGTPVEQPKKTEDVAASLSLSKKLGIALAALVIIALPVILALVLVEKNDEFRAPPTMAPTEIVIDPDSLVSSVEEKLQIILSAMNSDSELADDYAAMPKTVAGFTESSTDPFMRAGYWILNQDTRLEKAAIVDRFALAAVYFALAGENWANSEGWLSDEPACGSWTGVTCCRDFPIVFACHEAPDDMIIELDISNQNASGGFPRAVSLLQSLEALRLNNNNLIGPIPGSLIGNLRGLRKLHLHDCNFQGPIPNNLGANNKLDSLYLHRNRLTGQWPDEYCSRTGRSLPLYTDLRDFRFDCDRHGCNFDSCPCSYRQNCFGNTVRESVIGPVFF